MIDRLRLQKVLEISTNDRKYKFYTQKPDEFRTIIEESMHES
ncbi:hypothetical protein [uncultured Methanolobus sp.]|nr:hypothetical protein [uncultured Methanolobus sp.]